MKKKLLVILYILLIRSNDVWPLTTIDHSNILKILSFNIFHGETTRGNFNIDAIAKVIIQANPDLVSLQEVDFQTRRVKKCDLAKELGIRTKMIPLFGRAMKFDDGEYGVAILSKYSFIKTRNVSLPYSSENEPRTALEVVVELSSKDTIAFLGTHLDHMIDGKDRIVQAKKINKAFGSNKYPTILAGDLNASPGSTTINILEDKWFSCYDKENPAPTYPSNNPVNKIDYVMFYPESKWKILSTKIIQDSIASDHCAYLVTLRLLN